MRLCTVENNPINLVDPDGREASGYAAAAAADAAEIAGAGASGMVVASALALVALAAALAGGAYVVVAAAHANADLQMQETLAKLENDRAIRGRAEGVATDSAPEPQAGGAGARAGGPPGFCRQGQIHHIATDKSVKSGYTATFEDIFAKAGMSLQDPANKVFLDGHRGRHSPLYHEYVLGRLRDATRDLSGEDYTTALKSELEQLKLELLNRPEILRGSCP